MDEQSEVVRQALDYPYAIPPRSFAQLGERTLGLGEVEVDLSERTPLLAYGSNAAPEVLAHKLAGHPDPVPLLRATLRDFDIVYSAHISPYGAVPATLQRSPGTEATVFVAHLTAGQHRAISKTEPNYELAELRDASCRLEDGESLGRLPAYLSRHGCLLLDGSEVALAAAEARRRTLPEMSERELLERVRRVLCPERSLEEFVCAAAAEPESSRRWTKRLRESARALSSNCGEAA